MTKNSKVVRISSDVARELEKIRQQAMREFGEYWSDAKCLKELMKK